MMPDVNVFAIVVAGVAGFFVGGLWYSARMFGSVWSRENGPHPHEAQKKHPAMAFAVSIVLSIIAAGALAVWLGPRPELGQAVCQGRAGRGLLRRDQLWNQLSVRGRTNKLWLIDAGYHLCQFTIFGLVLGLWH
jgi:hypothetical protein